jgi:hypothetical protein
LKLGSFGGSGEHDGDGREPDETEEVLRLLVVSGRHAPVLFDASAGDYSLRIPELAAPAKAPAAPEAPNEKLARLKKELDQVRAREAELADEIKRLELELKKRN